MGEYTRVIPLHRSVEGRHMYLLGFVSGYDNERAPPRDQALLTGYIVEKSKYLE